ncbi:MAG TPA: hypothetical protein VN864_00535, partial [Thermoplasmata archaeon]|nr:hypothetical protein [Thermoplasmata archaeon]
MTADPRLRVRSPAGWLSLLGVLGIAALMFVPIAALGPLPPPLMHVPGAARDVAVHPANGRGNGSGGNGSGGNGSSGNGSGGNGSGGNGSGGNGSRGNGSGGNGSGGNGSGGNGS